MKLPHMTFAATLSLLLGCAGDTGHIDVGVSSSSQLALAKAGVGTHLTVEIKAVEVHVAGADEADEADAGANSTATVTDKAGWVTVFSGSAIIDLYDAVTTEAFLGGADVPAGKITQIRLVLAGDPTIDVDGQPRTVTCPSCTETGLKIVTEGKLVLAAGATLHLDLAFDQAASVVAVPGGYRLDPVVKITSHPGK